MAAPIRDRRVSLALRTLAVLPAVLLAALPLGGCYVLHAAAGQMDLNARRVPVAKVVANPATPPAVRTQLELATRIRDFATRELALPDNGSYRSYADIGRPYVVWNVFATPELSVEPKTWCFPFAGCVAYRGYFAEAKAQRFARELRERGYDVLVGGVPAYSTLGHFADPLLSTMVGWSEPYLAGIVFHELAHQLVYVPGDSAFNEAFATVVENEGVRRWLAAEGREAALANVRARQARYFAVADLVTAARARLRAVYASALTDDEKRARKAAEFARLRAEYARLKAAWGAGGYEWLFGAEMNNASLLAVATYHDCVPGLEARLGAAGRDLPAFYADVRRLARLTRADRHAAVCRTGAPGAPDAGSAGADGERGTATGAEAGAAPVSAPPSAAARSSSP